MNAIELLEDQHRQVRELFDELDQSDALFRRRRLLDDIADALAIHAEIEERLFYPEVRAHRSEDILLESLEPHHSLKRLLASLLHHDATDADFDSLCTVLEEQVLEHVEAEERSLFPKVQRLFEPAKLDELGRGMRRLEEQMLAAGAPRNLILSSLDLDAAPHRI